MNKANSETAILSISLDRGAKASLQNQLLQSLRDLVHAGRLTSGNRLPSSRNLAQELAVSRVTTTAVYDQLIAEGYLEGKRGSGVFVASDLPDIAVRTQKSAASPPEEPLPGNSTLRPFSVGYPDLAAFPYRDWTRTHDRIWRAPGKDILGQSQPMGFGPLRSAIATHLREWRGIECTGAQIVVTSGLMDALELIAKATLSIGDTVLVEEPGHKILINALGNVGMNCVPVPVDEQGLNLSAVNAECIRAKTVAVTPSRQYPLGMTLSLARRLEVLEWAEKADGLILEDDYDGEFRYQGQPLPAMTSLDDSGRVIYIGSFSKVMFPALRLGYIVLPKRVLPLVSKVLAQTGPRAAHISQPVLAEFMKDGALATHIRRMRRLYGERQKALLGALTTHAQDLLQADAETGGMHLVAELSPMLAGRMDDTDVSDVARAHDIHVAPLSGFYRGNRRKQGLVMGYAAFDPHEISSSIRTLAHALRS
ncbi:MAG: PLP-dependent aminotransferase family protein [Pseudomonadota bacterium]